MKEFKIRLCNFAEPYFLTILLLFPTNYAIMRPALLIFCGIVLWLSACERGKETEQVKAQPTNYRLTGSDLDPVLQKLLGADSTGLFRGLSLGQSREKVKIIEDSLTIVEETDTLINYTLSFTATEEADLIYYFKDNTLKKIEADLYPPGEQDQTKLFNELQSFYSAQYGAFHEIDKGEVVWIIPKQELLISLKKTGNEKVHDLQLTFLTLNKDSIQ